MSTAIDYSALLKRAKAAKKSAAQKPSSSTTISTSPKEGFAKRTTNRDSVNEEFRVSPDGLDRALYVPNFITEEEEQFAMSQIYATEDTPVASSSKWVQLSHRRLKVYGGTPDAQGTLTKPLPTWVEDFLMNCTEPFLAATPPLEAVSGDQKPNHVLLNEYSGGMGIAAHFDGPLYYNRVLVLNLQSPATLYFYKEKVGESQHLTPVFSVVLEPRSLLVFEGELYTSLKHGIPNAIQDDLRELPPANSRFLSAETRALLDAGEPLSRGFLPRLSLTLRKIRFKGKSEDDISTKAEQEELRRAEINFYRNVSELN